MSIRITKLNDTAMLVDSIALGRTIGAMVKARTDTQEWVFSPSDGLVFKLTTLKDLVAVAQRLTDADAKAERDAANRREITRLQDEIDGIAHRDGPRRGLRLMPRTLDAER